MPRRHTVGTTRRTSNPTPSKTAWHARHPNTANKGIIIRVKRISADQKTMTKLAWIITNKATTQPLLRAHFTLFELSRNGFCQKCWRTSDTSSQTGQIKSATSPHINPDR
jgi:hypothetical protein